MKLYKERDEWGYDVTYGQNPRGSGERIPMLMLREGGRLDLLLGDIFGWTEARTREMEPIKTLVPLFQDIDSAMLVPREGQRYYGILIDWSTQDAIILWDVIAFAGDLATFVFPHVGWYVSSIASIVSYSLTRSEYFKGNASYQNEREAAANMYFGFFPFIGTYSSYRQLTYDWNRR